MLNVNFEAYHTYVTDSIYQWDKNRFLTFTGLNLTTLPEVHFSNALMDKALPVQVVKIRDGYKVKIPNSLLQCPVKIIGYIGFYVDSEFRTVEKMEIPVIPRKKPADYVIEDTDGEIYSFVQLQNDISNAVAQMQTTVNEKVAETLNDVDEKTSLLESQIENLVANTGDTAENSELVDIRVGADTTTYATAGAAVRGQIKTAEKNAEGICQSTFNFDPNLFRLGSWNNDDVTSLGEKNRIATIGAVYFPFDVTLRIKEGFQIRGYWCNELGVSIDTLQWRTSPLIIPAFQKIKIVVARITETATEEANISEFLSKIPLKGRLREDVDYIDKSFTNFTKDSFTFDAEKFSHGWIEGWNNGIYNDAPKYRVATPEIQTFRYNTTIRSENDFRFALNLYDNGVFYSDEGWTTEYTVPGGQQFKIMIARSTDINTEIVNVADFVSKLSLRSEYLEVKEQLVADINDVNENIEKTPIYFPKNKSVNSINHRGYNTVAPENTLPAFKLSKKNGFNFVETDVRFTSDGIPVLLHDATINRTGRNANGSTITNTINISDITLADALTYDFGIWKSQTYAGTKIPTFEEFIILCRNLGLHPYIEIEGEISQSRAQLLLDIVKESGLENDVTWISFAYESLLRIVELYSKARVGLNCITTDGLTVNQTHYAGLLREISNNVFYNIDPNSIEKCVEMGKSDGLPVEIWCPNTEEAILALPSYISGVTSDNLIAETVLYNAYID